jgi:hypothetical protein
VSSGSGKRLRENEILDYIEKHIDKILEVHGLSKENALFVTELIFPHGRADAVIYGLYEDLYVVPIGMEVKTSIKSGTELYYYISQLRETYEYAFPIIYLATNKLEDGGRKKEEESKRRNIIRDYLNEIGYGLIEVDRDDISISLPANPKKTPKSEYDYCEVASKGLLYLATAKVLKERRFERALKVSSLWIGIDANISYCGFTRGSYAVFGVYAWGSSSVKQLLEFILNEESLIRNLAKAGYRVYVESYLTAMGRVIGYVRHLDETLSMSTVEAIHKIMKKKNKLSMIRGWGMGLGIYRPLWEAFFMPSYPTALQMINRTMDELADFRDLVDSSLARSRAESKE